MKERTWNYLTILVLITTLLVMGFVGVVFANPYGGYNPFPPPPLPDKLVLPTATSTYLQLPPTWTFTPPPLIEKPTLLPSSTIQSTNTSVVLPTATLTSTATLTMTYTTTIQATRTRTRTPTVTEEQPPPQQPTDTSPPPTDTDTPEPSPTSPP